MSSRNLKKAGHTHTLTCKNRGELYDLSQEQVIEELNSLNK